MATWPTSSVRLQVRLVERDRAGVEPTAAGQILLVPAREALRAERNARMAAAQLHGLLKGRLVVGGSTIPAVHILPGLIARFRERHEGIVVTLRTGDSADIAALVATGDVDVGLIGTHADRRVERHDYGGDELVLVVHPQHELVGRDGVTLDDLADLPMVVREEGSGTRATVLEALAAASGGDVRLHTAVHVGSTAAVKACVRAGLGAAFVSDLAIVDEVAAGHLVVLPIEDFAVKRSFELIHRDEERMSPAGRAFKDEILRGDIA